MAFDFPPGTEGLEFSPLPGLTYKYVTNRWTVKSQTSPGAQVIVSDTPPSNPSAGTFWWESDSGSLFIWYTDGNSSQWVQVNVPSDFTLGTQFVSKAGDTMTGDLFLTNPASPGPTIQLIRNNPTPAALDITGTLLFMFNSLSAVKKTAAGFNAAIAVPTDGAESTYLTVNTRSAGSLVDQARFGLNPAGTPMRGIGLTGGQLAFPATANPSTDANTLDDYREGTWVPDLRFGGNAVGMTYGLRTGTYTRVGNQVTAQFRITLTAKGTSTGTVSVGGLPFTTSNNLFTGAVGYAVNFAGLAGTPITFYAQSNALNVRQWSSVGASALTDAVFANTSDFFASLTYEAA